MQKIDIFIVRFIPVVMFLWSGIDLVLSALGRWMTCANILLGWNAALSAALFAVSLSNSRYHCTWNRCMYGYLVAVPMINYTDAKIGMFASVEDYICFFAAIYSIILLATLIMAVKHYSNARKRKKRSSVGD